jgi:hypothetical protein
MAEDLCRVLYSGIHVLNLGMDERVHSAFSKNIVYSWPEFDGKFYITSSHVIITANHPPYVYSDASRSHIKEIHYKKGITGKCTATLAFKIAKELHDTAVFKITHLDDQAWAKIVAALNTPIGQVARDWVVGEYEDDVTIVRVDPRELLFKRHRISTF